MSASTVRARARRSARAHPVVSVLLVVVVGFVPVGAVRADAVGDLRTGDSTPAGSVVTAWVQLLRAGAAAGGSAWGDGGRRRRVAQPGGALEWHRRRLGK